MIISGGKIFSISQRSEYPVEIQQPLEKIIFGNIPAQVDVPKPDATLPVVISPEVIKRLEDGINDIFDAQDAKMALEEAKLHGFKDWEDVKRDIGL